MVQVGTSDKLKKETTTLSSVAKERWNNIDDKEFSAMPNNGGMKWKTLFSLMKIWNGKRSSH